MKNNKGIGRFELMTVIVLLLILFAYLGTVFLGGAGSQKLHTMEDNAIVFSKAVTVNMESFHNTSKVYLDEVIDEELMKKMKNPTGKGYCSGSESIVQIINGMPYVTLKCGKYLLDKVNFSSDKEITYYEVTEWSKEKKEDSNDQAVLYNCTKDGKELFEEYYEELYFIYRINKKFHTNHFFVSNINNECKVVSSTFYRTKKEVKTT